MSDPHDAPRLERLLGDALAAEGRRARPAPDAWARIRLALGQRGAASRLWMAAAAAALVLVLGGVAAVLLFDDDPADQDVQVGTDPTAPDTSTTEDPATTTTAPTTTTTEDTTTTSVDDQGREVVVDPIEIEPLPPRRDAPPTTIAAVTADGRLVLVDTATGEVTREVAHHGDLRDDGGEGPPSGIDGVALSPSGERVWYSVCCEPAAGALYEELLAPGAEPQPSPNPTTGQFAVAYEPQFTHSPRWATHNSGVAASVSDLSGGPSRVLRAGDTGGFSRAVLSTDGRHLVVTLWDDGPGDHLRAVPTERVAVMPTFSGDDSGTRELVAEPRELPGEGWALPTFARDGRLLAAQHSDGGWTPRLLDIDTGEIVDADWSYDGVPLDQDHDATGEWLLYVVADAEDSLAGTLRWVGPDGQTGSVPGTYYAASW